MATPDQESVDTFMSITGSSELVAIRKLTEHHGVLNEAVNSYFTEGDANIRHETNAAPQHNSMDTDETDGAFHESHHADIASGTGDVTSTLPEIIPETRVTGGTDDDVLGGISRDTCAAPSALVSLSVHDEAEDAEEQPLVRRRRRRVSSTSGPTQQQNWGGISSEEQEEAVMLEAAMFDGVSERAGYARNYYTRNGLGRTNGPYTRSARARVRAPRPPSPSLTAQRLIREQQDNEYHAALQADKEKELLEQAAREAAMEEEQRKLEQEREMERQLAVKEASLPQEPASGDENAVTLLVRMPDGSRRGRRFLKTNKLQCLFDFIDVGRVVKPSTYRLVRPYPKRSFGDGENGLTLNELGLSSKQEALFLELI